jgi:FKBP-type peptidyl-prolyl cis-trans isomerase
LIRALIAAMALQTAEGNYSVQHWKWIAAAALAATALSAALFAQDDQSFEPEKASAAPKDLSQDAAWLNQQMLALAKLHWQDGWRILPGGIRIRLISGDGSGPHPSVSDVIKLNYEGKLTDGTVFDSSFARGEPEIFPLTQLIRGWQMAVPQMGVGDTAEIAIPAEYAYGPRGKGPIPAGATLFFKIELLGIAPRN